MKINRFLLVSAALWFAATAVTFAENPQLGTWKLDESKSTFAPGATKNNTVTYTEANDGMITLTVDGADKDGKPIHWTWTGNSTASRTRWKEARWSIQSPPNG